MIGNLVFVLLLIPTLIWATLQYGTTGAGWAWLAANAIYFLTWVPKVHGRFVTGLHVQWLLSDVGAIVLLALIGVAVAHGFVTWPHDRAEVTTRIGVVSLALLAIAAAGSSWVRETISGKWRARFAAQG